MTDDTSLTPQQHLETLREVNRRIERDIRLAKNERAQVKQEGAIFGVAELTNKIQALDEQRQALSPKIQKAKKLVKQSEATERAMHVKHCAYRLAARDVLDEVTLKRIDDRASEIRKEMKEKKAG